MIGNINTIETLGLNDGPGIRFIVFMQGCTLRCKFCHNPEMWKQQEKAKVQAEELVRKIYKYKNYFGETGGVTFSGGEPLLQRDFLLELLILCKKMGINTCIETAGIGENYEEILKHVDLVIWDIKGIDEESYKEITGQNKYQDSIKFIMKCMEMNKKIWLRHVIIPNYNDNEEYIIKLKKFIKMIKYEKIELLPYHTMGKEKYEQQNIIYKMQDIPAMDKEKCEELYKKLTEID